MSNFNDIVLNELKIKEKHVLLNEGVIPLSPFLAVAALKQKAFKRLRRLKSFITKRTFKAPLKIKAKAGIAAEKAKAAVGVPSGKGEEATVYKLTNEQVKVINDILKRHGSDLVSDIMEFRRGVLAPYQRIKRIIKKSKQVSSKDITGMTLEQFKAAVESGRKKIESRGEEHYEKFDDLRDELKTHDKKISALEQMRKNFMAGGKPSYNIANSVYISYGVGDAELEGYSREHLRRSYDKISKTRKELEQEARRLRTKGALTPSDFARSKELIKQSRELQTKGVDLTDVGSKDFQTEKGDFNVALGRYFFSKEIWKELMKPGTFNMYKKTYLSIVDEMLKKAKKLKQKNFTDMVKLKKLAVFTDKEKKIWELRPGIKEFSSNLKDYYQKVTLDQFLEKPITIKKSPELIKAQREIENEIRRFERKLGKVVTAEELSNLKRFRLINNPILVKEFQSPEKMFKARQDFDEYEEEPEEISAEEEPEVSKEDYVSKAEFLRKIREIATVEYDTMSELQNAKKEAKSLTKQMIDQGDKEIIDEHRDILRRIDMRRTTSAQRLIGHEFEPTGIVDIDDIQRLANRIINKTYTSTDVIKHDKLRLDKLISQYEKADPEDAEKNLGEIDFLLKRAKRKLEVGK